MQIWNGGTVPRLVSNSDAAALLDLARKFGAEQLTPIADTCEEDGLFPRELISTLGELGLLNLPFAHVRDADMEPVGVSTNLQILEELATAWMTVGLALSVHQLAASALVKFGSQDQKDLWLDWVIGGNTLGAYCLSEPHSGSDAAALRTTAVREGLQYRLNGVKAWITHGGVADFYIVMARTSEHKTQGISCFFVPADTPGLTFGAHERKMGGNASPTAQVHLDNVLIPEIHRIGVEGQGLAIALSSLDMGRLGISACAVGLAQSALNTAGKYAGEREQFGQAIANFQGVGFMLADMATSIAASRALYLDAAFRVEIGAHGGIGAAAAMSKLMATDSAMKVTTDAVQVLGGNGYTKDYPVERYMREAKVLQIVEGTNQIQRLVISRSLQSEAGE